MREQQPTLLARPLGSGLALTSSHLHHPLLVYDVDLFYFLAQPRSPLR